MSEKKTVSKHEARLAEIESLQEKIKETLASPALASEIEKQEAAESK